MPVLTEVSWVIDPDRVEHRMPLDGIGHPRADQGPDTARFVSAPTVRGVDLLGPVSFRAVAQADGAGSRLTVTLSDVAPDGRTVVLMAGEHPCRPGRDRVRLDLGVLSYRLERGHAIRLDLHGVPGDAGGTILRHRVSIGGMDGAHLALVVRDQPWTGVDVD